MENRSVCVGCNGKFPEGYNEAIEGNMCKICFEKFLKGCRPNKPSKWTFWDCSQCKRNFTPHTKSKRCCGCLGKEVK